MSEFLIYPLGLLGLLAIPIVVIIYLLRSRYKTKEVSSTFIWKRSLKYVKRRIPLNFIMSLLLILQILIVVVASFAIARPTIKPLKTEEKIIILDASASMQTLDNGVSRFDVAKKEIEKVAEKIGENHKMTLILAGENPIPVIQRTEDKGAFLSAMKPLACELKGSDINGALDLAAEYLNQNKGAEVLLYTDKSYIETDGIQVVDCKRETEWNAGIISLEDNRIAIKDTLGKGGYGYEFIVNVGNYGMASEFTVKLKVDDKVVGQRILSLGSGEEKQLRFTHSPTQDTGKNEIRIAMSKIESYQAATVELSANDSFAFDNSMTIYPKYEKDDLKIMYVSKYVVLDGGKKQANKSFLNFALKANGYTVESDDMYNNIDEIEELKGYDIYIFEGITPYYLPTDGAVWLVDCDNMNTIKSQLGSSLTFSQSSGVVVGEEMLATDAGYLIEKAIGENAASELLENVHIDIPLNFAGQPVPAAANTYRPITSLGPAFREVYKTGNDNLIVAGTYKTVPMVISTFDFKNSSLIAYISDFPMLIKNMINYSVSEPLQERSADIGKEIVFKFPVGATNIDRYLDGKLESSINIEEYIASLEEKRKEDPNFVIEDHINDTFEITSPGKYEIIVTFPDGDDKDNLFDTKRYAITGHISPEETRITEQVATDDLTYPEVAANAKVEYSRVEIFPWVIGLFIILLIIEWGVYYREQY